MKIEIVETVGKKVSNILIGNAFEALKASGLNGKVVIVKDIQTALKYGIKATPAIVMNGVVMFVGTYPSCDEILRMIQRSFPTVS